MTVAETESLSTIIAGHCDNLARWDRHLAGRNVAPDDGRIYDRAARLHTDRAADRLAATQPEWLTRTLGERSTAPAAAQVWNDAVREVAAFRARHQITDNSTPLGTAPVATPEAWDAASTALAQARILARHLLTDSRGPAPCPDDG